MDEKGEAPAIRVSQGVQAGTGNVQHNTFVSKMPLDPIALSQLSPHTAVARLRSMPHDELVDVFAKASSADVVEVLAAFLMVDNVMVIAILADVNRRKATEFIATLNAPEQWLTKLPGAAEAIARKAAQLKWDQAGKLERFEDGYVRKYKNGTVFWSADQGVHAASGAIERYWTANKDSLGLPYGYEETAASSPRGTVGTFQRFEGVAVYSSPYGTHAVDWRYGECYSREGGSAGWLGFPIADGEEGDGRACFQCFEDGVICHLDKANVYAVRLDVWKLLSSNKEFRPLSRETATTSSTGNVGSTQRFLVSLNDAGRETAAYRASGRHVVLVDLEMWSYYCDLSAESSWLGFPTHPALIHESGMRIQPFEEGAIYWRQETGPIAVSDAVSDVVLKHRVSRGKIGYAISDERMIGAGPDRIQFFDHGAVVMREGKQEILLRLEPEDQRVVETGESRTITSVTETPPHRPRARARYGTEGTP